MTVEIFFPIILFGCLGLILASCTAVVIGFAIKEIQDTFR